MNKVYCRFRNNYSGYRKAGDTIGFQIDFCTVDGNSTQVDITGTPYVLFNITQSSGLIGVRAYFTGTPIANCTGTGVAYTVQAGDKTTTNGPVDFYGPPYVYLNGGSITQLGQPVELVMVPVSGSTTDYLSGPEIYLQTTGPTFSLVSCNKVAVVTGNVLTSTFTCNQMVTGTVTAKVAGTRDMTLRSTDAGTWTFDYTVVSADSEGSISVTVAGPNIAGVSGSTVIQLPCIVDRTPPPTPAKPTPISALNSTGTVAFTWSPVTDTGSGTREYVAKIVKNAVEVFNGSVGQSLSASLSGTVVSGQYTCSVKAIDNVGNESPWSSASDAAVIDYTYATPIIETSGTYAKNASAVTVEISFRDSKNFTNVIAVCGFSRSSIKLTNAAMGDLEEVFPGDYNLTIYPTSNGTVTMQILAGAAVGDNGQLSIASGVWTFTFDNVRPSCTVKASATAAHVSPVAFVITFSKPVTGLAKQVIHVTGGTCASVSGSSKLWTAYISPEATARPTDITCDIPAGVTSDDSANANLASNVAAVVFDDVAPTISAMNGTDVAGTYYGIGDVIRIAVTFSKTVFVTTSGGTPVLNLVLGSTTRQATYQSGSGSDVLIFAYTIASGDPACALDHSTMVLSGGTIRDYAGNAATLTLGSGMLAASDIRIDTSRAPYSTTFPCINDDVAPTATVSSLPVSNTTLTKAMRSGIGDKDDLKTEIVCDSHEQWMPRLKHGWFYYKEREFYLFAKKLTKSTTNYAVGAAVTLTNADPNYDITKVTKYGPVFVKGTVSSVSMPYTQVSSPLRVLVTLTSPTQIPGTNNYSYSVPGIPVELVRTDASQPMRRVPSADAIQDSNEYYQYSSIANDALVYTIVVADAAAVYATYIPTADSDLFVQHEVCTISSKMQIRAMYRDVITTKTGKNPVVIAIDNGVRVAIAAESICSGNVITLPASYAYTRPDGTSATLTLEPGDRVGLTYYVDRSYVIDGSKVYAYTAAATTISTLTVEYEGSTEEKWDGTKLVSGSGSYVQLNPLKDGVAPGFLYLVDENTLDLEPADISISASPGAVTVNSSAAAAQPVRICVKLTDRNGDPIHGASVLLSSRGILPLVKDASNTVVLPSIPQTIGGANVVVDGVGHYVDSVYSLYPTSAYTVAWQNGTGWILTWQTPPPTGQAYVVNYYPAMGTYSSFYPAGKTTDWRGEMRAIWTPTIPANTFLAANIPAGGLYRETAVVQSDYSALATTAFDNASLIKKVYLNVTGESQEPGTIKVRAYVSDITGSYPMRNVAVTFCCSSSKFATATPVLTNNDGVSENTYYLSGADTIYACASGIYSNRIIMTGATS